MEPTPDQIQNFDVWILAGQSNMAGSAPIAGAPEPHAEVFSFSSAGRWEQAQEPLHRLWESYTPVNQNFMRALLPEGERNWSNEKLAERELRAGLNCGPGLAFGRALHELSGKTIGLLPCAHHGTRLDDWSAARKNEGTLSLYGGMLDRVQRAGGNLKGVLWYQGEGDGRPEYAETYASRFDGWIAALRADLNRPDLPVVAVQLGRSISDEWHGSIKSWATVREALSTLPLRVPHTAATTTIDLGLCDSGHIDTPGLIRLGGRMARLAMELERNISSELKVLGPHVERIRIVESRPGVDEIYLECSGVSGGWKIRHHLSGFKLHPADATECEEHAQIRIVDASVLSDSESTLRLLLNRKITEPITVSYGYAMNPYCNIVDQFDMALPAFSPREISSIRNPQSL